MERADVPRKHRVRIPFEFVPIYIEARLVFGEVHHELQFARFDLFEICVREGCVNGRSAERRSGFESWWSRRNDIRQDHRWIGIAVRTSVKAARAECDLRIR